MSTISVKEKHHRQSIRLKEYDYSQPGAYFVTICAHRNENVFGEVINSEISLNKFGKLVESTWLDLPKHYPNVKTDVYEIMPNHFHGVVFLVGAGFKPAPTKYPLSEIVRGFKTFSSRRINKIRNMSGVPVWQRNYYEHVIRYENELNRIREYILYNPLQWAYDRENPEHVQDINYDQQWGEFEKIIFEKRINKQHACST